MLKSRWFVPVFTAALGLPILAASWIGGQPGAGVTGLVVTVVFAIVLLFAGRRSETIRGLAGPSEMGRRLLQQRDKR